MMSRIRANDTRPELLVRRFLHAAGLRFRIHQRSLPGTPDIVLRRFNTAIFVNGCFWHRHTGCKYATTPSSNEEFWKEKLAANIDRDQRNIQQLVALGWHVIVVWECALRAPRTDITLKELVGQIRRTDAKLICVD
jgi:DNA mismatch endonuclease (patch repair protein)